MTRMNVASPALPRGFFLDRPARRHLYLRPTGMISADGRIMLNDVDVLLREERNVFRASLPVSAVIEWAEREGEEAIGRVDELLSNCTAARTTFAGLSLDQPTLMGIVNVTPDSFSDGGVFARTDLAIDHGLTMAAEGAAIIDIGGESTRPGADPVPADEELRRVMPVIEGLRGRGAMLSVDTHKAAVMREALNAGVAIVNDVSALRADNMEAVAASDASVILMHMRGDPQTMQRDTAYDYLPLDIFDFFEERIAACEAAGIDRSRIAVDPGLGFGKTREQNFELIHCLALYHCLGCPIVMGASRKFVSRGAARHPKLQDRLPGSLVAAIAALDRGVQILRVHEVTQTVEAIATWQGIREAGSGPAHGSRLSIVDNLQ